MQQKTSAKESGGLWLALAAMTFELAPLDCKRLVVYGKGARGCALVHANTQAIRAGEAVKIEAFAVDKSDLHFGRGTTASAGAQTLRLKNLD